MNDCYLFRGERLDNGECVQGHYVPGHFQDTNFLWVRQDGNYRYTGWCSVDPSIIGKCTGLRDKNGMLIFENDILRIDCKDIHGEAKVAFSRGAFVVGDYQLGELLGDFMAFDLEIIGNAHDNPELLGDASVDDDSKPKAEPWAMLCRQRDVKVER